MMRAWWATKERALEWEGWTSSPQWFYARRASGPAPYSQHAAHSLSFGHLHTGGPHTFCPTLQSEPCCGSPPCWDSNADAAISWPPAPKRGLARGTLTRQLSPLKQIYAAGCARSVIA